MSSKIIRRGWQNLGLAFVLFARLQHPRFEKHVHQQELVRLLP
jgi:hypothetical protein